MKKSTILSILLLVVAFADVATAQIEILVGAAVVAGGVAVVGGGTAAVLKVAKKIKEEKEDDDDNGGGGGGGGHDNASKDEDDSPNDSPDEVIISTYGFLFSKADDGTKYCITANNGVRKGAVVELKPCSFDEPRNGQLWGFSNHQIASAKDSEQCLTATGNEPTARIRMGPCSSDHTNLNTFKHNGDQTNKPIRVKDDQSLCFTNLGETLDAGDPVVVGECQDHPLLFTFKEH